VTTEEVLTPRGDCIIGVGADKGAAGLNERLMRHIRNGGGMLFELRVSGGSFTFEGWGSGSLELSDPTSVVIRRSSFASPRTIAIRSSAAAIDVPRELVEELRKGQRGIMLIYARDAGSGADRPVRGLRLPRFPSARAADGDVRRSLNDFIR